MKIRYRAMNKMNPAFAILVCLAVLCLAAAADDKAPAQATATPIQHLVVIFQENVSFDHYFGTYPLGFASASPDTPSVNNLLSAGLLGHNPNSTQPFLLTRAENYTCDQNHDYKPEQQAFNGGLMDKFPESVGVGGGSPPVTSRRALA